jgi:general secretion pathway protein E
MHGESIVLRLLDRGQIRLGLGELGLEAGKLAEFQRLITRTNGIILVTGPTGSGKTTTLYAALNAINSPEKKIITVEDPVEYQLHGINQMQVREKIGFTFSNGLRHILRQDPDIIMVGEIRDEDTARMAIQAALTGHLVFSTLHTNDAPSAVTRLLDMGIEPYLVASTVRGMMAQRLVRVLCPHCREAYTPDAAELERVGLRLEGKAKVYRVVGCEKCGRTGYHGRTAIYEMLLLTPQLGRLVTERASSDELRAAVVQQGVTTLRDDGLAKVLDGVTSLSEILRVTES